MHHQDCSDIITAIEEIDPVLQEPSEISVTLIPQIGTLNCPTRTLNDLLEASIMTCHDALVQAVIDQYLRLRTPIPNQTDTVITAWDTMKTGTSNGFSVESYMVDYMGDDAHQTPLDPRIRALNMIQILLNHNAITIPQNFVSFELNPLLECPTHSIQPDLIDKINQVKDKIDEVKNTHSQPASRSPSPPAALSVECLPPPGVTTLTESSSGDDSSIRQPR